MIAVAGGTGFVGSHVARELLRRGRSVRVLIRPSSHKGPRQRAWEEARLREAGAETVRADALQPETLAAALSGCEAVVNAIGIIVERGRLTHERAHVEATANLLAAARGAGVRKFVLQSALGAGADAPTRYWRTKAASEEAVRASGLSWTIFRTSAVIGEGDGFTNLFADLLRAPLVPLAGGGRARLQPIAAADLARAIATACDDRRTDARLFELGGPAVFTFREMLSTVAALRGKSPRYVSLPPALLAAPAWFFQTFLSNPPLTLEQLAMSQLDNVVSDPASPYADVFPGPWTGFRDAARAASAARDEGLGSLSSGQFLIPNRVGNEKT